MRGAVPGSMNGREVFGRVFAVAVRDSVVFLMFAFIVAGVGSVFRWVLTVGFWEFLAIVGWSAVHTALIMAMGVVILVRSFFRKELPSGRGWLALAQFVRVVEVGIDVSLVWFLWSQWAESR